MKEVLFDIAHTGFDAPYITGAWLKAVVSCKIQISGMKKRLFAARMLQDGSLGVVDEHFFWDTAKKFEGVLISLQEVFGSLFEAELDVA